MEQFQRNMVCSFRNYVYDSLFKEFVLLRRAISLKVNYEKVKFSNHVFSSPEPSGSQGELIVYPCSGVRLFTISNIFSSETARPIKAKFYVEPPWEGRKKVCINGPGHMTKMAVMPIYGKNLKPEDQWSCKCSPDIKA